MNNVDIVRVVLQNSIFILLPVLLGRERKPMCAVIQVHSNRKCGTKSLVCTRRILGRDYCKLGQKPKSLGDFTKMEGTQMEMFNFLWLI